MPSPKASADRPSTPCPYCEAARPTAHAAMPVSSITRLPPTSEGERNRRSGTSGARERFSIVTKAAPSTIAAATSSSVRALPHPAWGASTTGVDQRDERGREGHGAARIQRARAGRSALVEQARGEHEQRHGDGDVDEEDRLPAEHVGQRPAGEQRRRRAEAAEAAPHGERAVALGSLGEGRHEDGQRRGRHDRGRDALRDARADEDGRRPGQPAQQRRDAEQRGAGQEHAPAPEQIARAAAEQEQAAEREQVRAEHPPRALGREAECVLDRRQREDHDLRVEDHHEVDEREQGERLRRAVHRDRASVVAGLSLGDQAGRPDSSAGAQTGTSAGSPKRAASELSMKATTSATLSPRRRSTSRT